MVVSVVPGATTACLLSLVKSLTNEASSQSDYQTIVSGSPSFDSFYDHFPRSHGPCPYRGVCCRAQLGRWCRQARPCGKEGAWPTGKFSRCRRGHQWPGIPAARKKWAA